MQENLNKKREEIERKRKVRVEGKEESVRKNKQRKTEGKEYESGKQLKRTRQQQKLENAEGKQEDGRLRSGKIRKTSLVTPQTPRGLNDIGPLQGEFSSKQDRVLCGWEPSGQGTKPST